MAPTPSLDLEKKPFKSFLKMLVIEVNIYFQVGGMAFGPDPAPAATFFHSGSGSDLLPILAPASTFANFGSGSVTLCFTYRVSQIFPIYSVMKLEIFMHFIGNPVYNASSIKI